jgi:GDP-L-fucose synthase
MPHDPRPFPPGARVFVAGGDTLIGTALLERLRESDAEIVGAPPAEPDLTDAVGVEDFFAESRPEYVWLTAGKSGGIRANQAYPATLMRDNVLVAVNVLEAARRHGVSRLLYLASSCCYPRLAAQPLRPESLTIGPLEPTNEAYATAKLAGLTLCRAYREEYGVDFLSAIPANSFGPRDDFSPEDSHVIPGLIRRLHEAKERGDSSFTVWGTGRARREFVYAPDLADACLFVMARYRGAGPINLGGGPDLAIADVARAVADVVGYRGQLCFDPSKPDGMPLKALDAGPLRDLGWTPATEFHDALARTYEWFLRNVKTLLAASASERRFGALARASDK